MDSVETVKDSIKEFVLNAEVEVKNQDNSSKEESDSSDKEVCNKLEVKEVEVVEPLKVEPTSDEASEDCEEYETADTEEMEHTDDRAEDESDIGSESTSGGSQDVPVEREEGDGQESEKREKKLDHDEDKRDPQYIPKKGNFYEHDDRTSEGEEPATGKKQPPQKAFDSKERWGHDLYDELLQSPKSNEELIEQYGYDIRLEEGPPKARRRRRYGRGPNKYTRRWEEEEAYSKTRGSWRGRGRGGRPRNSLEEFPPLPLKGTSHKTVDEKYEKNEDLLKKDESKKVEFKEEKKDIIHGPSIRKVKVEEVAAQTPPRGRGRGRGKPSLPFKSSSTQRQNSTAEEDIATLSQHFSEAVINVDNKSIPSQRASSVPPCGSDLNEHNKNVLSGEDSVSDKSVAEAKSKRYSSQRQRSLPQGTNGVSVVQQPQPPPPPPPQRFIQPDQQYFHQVGLETTGGAPGNQYPNQAPTSFTAEVPLVTFMSPAGHQFHQPLPPYLPPTYLPPPPLATPPRGPEVYQGPTGITYYNTQSQVSRPVSTSRRVRLAIPIVAPPESG